MEPPTPLLNYLFFLLRTDEFGLMAAIGYTHRDLAWRMVKETAVTSIIGWTIGTLGYAGIGLWLLNSYYEPRGMVFDWLNVRALAFTSPAPVIVAMFVLIPLMIRLRSLDPVAILTRRA